MAMGDLMERELCPASEDGRLRIMTAWRVATCAAGRGQRSDEGLNAQEQPERNEYLERLRGIGVDVSYLVSGSRQVAAGGDTLTVSYPALLNIYRIVDEFCVDEDGAPLPLEVRARFFQLLCASLKDKSGQDQTLDSLRNELRRLTGT